MKRRPYGALERDVLGVLWAASEPMLPAEINERLDAGYAYTSIATILTRLQAKGLVTRTPAGRAYAYRAASTSPTSRCDASASCSIPPRIEPRCSAGSSTP